MMRERLLRIPIWIGAVSAALGSLSFIGWLTANPSLARLMLPGAPLKPNGALALILLGPALTLLAIAPEKQRNSFFLAGRIAGLLAALLGAATLIEHWTSAGLAFDLFFVPDEMLIRPRALDVRMTKLSAATVTLLGAGLAIGRGRDRKFSLFGDVTFFISAALALTGIFTYAYGALPISGLGHALQVPLPAVGLTFLLALGGMLLQPDSRLVRPFISRGAGGQLIGKILPFVFIVPFALGALHITQMLSPENASMQAALSSAITAIVFSLVMWKAADELNRLDARKEQLDHERAGLERKAEREMARTDTEIGIRVATQAAYDELHKVTEKQRQTEAFFSGALNSAPLGFIFWDRNLRIIRLNSLVARWNGGDPRAYVGKKVEDVAPSFAPQVTPVLERILETGQPCPDVEILRGGDIDPEVRRLNGMFYPVANSTGEIIGIVAVISDVTREHARESALLETNERYSYVAKATNDAVWDLDVATNKLVWNESVHSLFGYSPDQVRGDLTWWEERVHPEDRERVVDSFHAAVDGGADIWETAYKFRNSDGSYSSVVDRGYMIRDDEGNARRAIGAMSDRTMQTALEESLRHSQKMDAVGRLSAGVAHDFNNVLALISVSAEFLLSVLEQG
ncbi:MAG: PAS domain-containing protein, partial [Gemmatimonadaceae bacterium]|nr:PAS domain-containing protein [Gemmatimonadaceae bacterium]